MRHKKMFWLSGLAVIGALAITYLGLRDQSQASGRMIVHSYEPPVFQSFEQQTDFAILKGSVWDHTKDLARQVGYGAEVLDHLEEADTDQTCEVYGHMRILDALAKLFECTDWKFTVDERHQLVTIYKLEDSQRRLEEARKELGFDQPKVR